MSPSNNSERKTVMGTSAPRELASRQCPANGQLSVLHSTRSAALDHRPSTVAGRRRRGSLSSLANVTGRMLHFLGRRAGSQDHPDAGRRRASALVLLTRLPACQRKKGLNHTVHGPSPV